MSFELVPVNAGEGKDAAKASVVLWGPYLQTHPSFWTFVNTVLKPSETTNGKTDDLTRLCSDRLVDYVRAEKHGLVKKMSPDASMTPEKRQIIADARGREDGGVDQRVLVVSTERDKVVGFLLAREMYSPSDVSLATLTVHVDLVCRDEDNEAARGRPMFERLKKWYLSSPGDLGTIRFTLDAIDTAIGLYEKWEFSRILNMKNTDSTNGDNGAFPMMHGLVREGGEWKPELSSKYSERYRFVKTQDKMKRDGDLERSRYDVEIISFR